MIIADLECWLADRLWRLAGLSLHYRRKLEWDASGRYLVASSSKEHRRR